MWKRWPYGLAFVGVNKGKCLQVFLKRSSSIRAARTLIPPLIHPTTQSLCTSKEAMLDAAATYYGTLYTPDAIDMNAVHDLLDAIPTSTRLSSSASQSMLEPITFDDLCKAFSRAPTTSSPGMDGLPCQLIHLIVTNPACRKIALATFNNALTHSDLPPSWLESCVVLLPKKGPPELLQNWRPISLINTDAKVFTRILSGRMIEQAASIINPFQTGFVRGRFIADNGLLMKLIMEHARTTSSSSIGLLLDQEKAYDRVHPVYLRAVLLCFGFPVALVDCISHLFFDNHLVVNVNGHLSPRVPQLRGLKQGDPISPILFNLAFEPLLRKILQDPELPGIQLPSPQSLPMPSAVKMMAYADDIVCLLTSPADLDRLHSHLRVYSAASNALVNFHKTEAISLRGSVRDYDLTWRTPLLKHCITSWHDATSASPIRYLGFPLFVEDSLG